MSKHKTIHISRMNNEQHDWQRGLEFYKQELQIHKHRLSDVAGMYDSMAELKANVEHFQNQFIVLPMTLRDDELRSTNPSRSVIH